MKTGILLSACMIVKNEEKNLERCLKSIKKLVDEIVVVDTGSTDQTVSIAKHFGARVYHHEWQNDFSLHRNQAISYAQGRWVMTIDADEELVLENNVDNKQIREFLRSMDNRYPAVCITFHDIQKGSDILQFNSARIFRRGLVEYKGMVHNQPTLKIEGNSVFCPGIHLKHYGYDLTPEQKAAKFERTHTLLMKQIETGQMDDMLPYFFLSQLYADNQQIHESVAWAEKYWENKDKIEKSHFCDSVYFTTTRQYMKIGDRDKAYEWLTRGIAALPGDLDMALIALEFGVWTKNTDLQIQACKDFLLSYSLFQKNPMMKGNRFVYALRPEALAYVYLHQTLSQIKDGTQALMNLMKLIPSLHPSYGQGMMKTLEEELSTSAFPVHFVKDLAESPVGDLKDKKENFVSSTIH
jgi:tetratricopeptide (TPR) repeat protein